MWGKHSQEISPNDKNNLWRLVATEYYAMMQWTFFRCDVRGMINWLVSFSNDRNTLIQACTCTVFTIISISFIFFQFSCTARHDPHQKQNSKQTKQMGICSVTHNKITITDYRLLHFRNFLGIAVLNITL